MKTVEMKNSCQLIIPRHLSNVNYYSVTDLIFHVDDHRLKLFAYQQSPFAGYDF